ncbi:Metallo-dependent phosphatase [Cryphonectria parasitica EP155]|uniref:Metallo-dependent phosphatase n=1 Tax=Cryphonectria parasitica (strain ATCC 38755 / EP155) TaxID=660469 RepID=A0A9P5CUH4_CRYP1|nr:Metallo-dependent phosphatase [Cryphonectria parasitica EP155]KAF3770060.1 Metallo-dependent phosphatase [Cryphonectria parasitica EP155]
MTWPHPRPPELSHPPEPVVEDQTPGLYLRNNKKFTLAIFSDLHFGEEEHGWGINQDINSTRVMNTVLDKEPSVDLVVLNGDLITGENTFKENSSAYVDQIVVPMVSRNIPWASTYGNHDSKFNLSREAILQAEKKYALSYTRQMGQGLPGVTNYYLLVQTGDGRPVAVIWFFDSRGGASYQQDPSGQDDLPNWVADETAAWFTAASRKIRSRYGRLPSIAFVHIPPHPFLAAQEAGLDPAHFPGLNEDVPVAIQGKGDSDDGFVDALLGEEGQLLHSIYVGHDHGDAWCSVWPVSRPRGRRRHDEMIAGGGGDDEEHSGPFLCFSRHTGYGGYGTWDRGSRIVQLSFEDTDGDGLLDDDDELRVDTWVRMESGKSIARVSLNETYGSDVYEGD